MSYRYFTDNDFRRATPQCSIDDMHPELLERLDVARFHADIPFVITSAYRTEQHELSKGRAGTSSHTLGRAVDIRASHSRERYYVLRGLMAAGFNRIGINRNSIHADCDGTKFPEVVWHYYP